MNHVAPSTLKQLFIPALGVPVSTCTQQELFAYMLDCLARRERVLIDNVNLDILWYAQQDEAYRQTLTQLSSANLVDGEPVRWLARMAGVTVPERLTLTDVVPRTFRLATEKNLAVFVVGSNPQILKTAFTQLDLDGILPDRIAAWSEKRELLLDDSINNQVLAQLEAFQPDILFAAMGSPFQTRWITANWDRLPPCIVIPVGGAFDYIARTVGRAPMWMQRSGLEWVYRLLFDHQKRERSLFERYVLNDLPFAFQVAGQIQFKRQPPVPIGKPADSAMLGGR